MGGICSGKSTVAGQLAGAGCVVIDADRIVHELLQTDEIKRELFAAFGEDIADESGRIDHQKLARTAFADAGYLGRLNDIIHPGVLRQAEELIEKFKRQTEPVAVVLDMPLLAEIGWHKRCDKLIFVDCEEKIRLKRAEKKRFFNKKQLKIRENFQISLDKKAKIADYIISNNSDIPALTEQVACVLSRITTNG
jgi:dephospho-CoA kinase